MPRARFTIRGLIAAIVACGLLFTSLREANALWHGITATLCLGIFAFALIASMCGERDSRVFWGGFAIGGLLHLALSCGPFLENSFGIKLLSSALLDLSYSRVAKPEPPPHIGGEPRPRTTRLPPADYFNAGQERWYDSLGLHDDFFGWANQSVFHSTATYRQIGHLWLCPLLGLATGRLAVRFQGANRLETTGAT